MDETMERKVSPGNPRPCAACPWRIANQGKRHRDSFYTKKNLRRLWSKIRRGERMTCHPTDPRMAEFEGYEKTAEAEQTHECTGSLILVQREMQRVDDAVKAEEEAGGRDGYKRYKREHPKGLTIEGVMEVIYRFSGMAQAFGGSKTTKPNLNEPGIGHPDLVPWEPR